MVCFRPGCTLPVEMFFPSAEFPTPELETALSSVGVVCRMLPLLAPAAIFANDTLGMLHSLFSTGQQLVEPQMEAFRMKVAALILSSFQEVQC